MATSIALEDIVEVPMTSASPGPEARQQVRWDEDRSPSFHLSDMNLLMVAAISQRSSIAANNHMAEGHRRRADSPSLQEPAGKTAVKLQRTGVSLEISSRGKREDSREQSKAGRRSSPQVD